MSTTPVTAQRGPVSNTASAPTGSGVESSRQVNRSPDVERLRSELATNSTSQRSGGAGEVTAKSGRKFQTSADGTPMYRQGDAEWGGRALGTGSSVGAAGCAMTATAMAISKISGKTITPGELDSYLDKNNGYAGNALKWDTAAKAAGLTQKSEPWNLNTLNKQVDAGRPAVVGVDYRPGSGGGANGTDHYVTITGRGQENGKNVYYANDPATGKSFKFRQEGNQLVSDYKARNGNPYRTTGVLHTFSGGPERPTGPARTGGAETPSTRPTPTPKPPTPGTSGTTTPGKTDKTDTTTTRPTPTPKPPTTTASGDGAPKQDLKVGSKGDSVKQLQQNLVKLGLMKQSEMDTGPGIYGPRTKAAVAKLQERYGITGNGGENYGPRSRAALEQALQGKGGNGNTGIVPPAKGGSQGTNTGVVPPKTDKQNGNTGVVPPNTAQAGTLSKDGNHQFTYNQLKPTIEKYAQKYGVDPKIMAGIIDQESTFKNHIVHRDGTGHGLIGLDDGGLLPSFEKWSGSKVGRGANAKPIDPEKQIEFLAKTLSETKKKYGGNEYMAAREWHTGAGGVRKAGGVEYEQLVKRRERELGLI